MLRLYDHPLGPGLTLKMCDKGRESSFENCDSAGLSDLHCKMFLDACTAVYDAQYTAKVSVSVMHQVGNTPLDDVVGPQ